MHMHTYIRVCVCGGGGVVGARDQEPETRGGAPVSCVTLFVNQCSPHMHQNLQHQHYDLLAGPEPAASVDDGHTPSHCKQQLQGALESIYRGDPRQQPKTRIHKTGRQGTARHIGTIEWPEHIGQLTVTKRNAVVMPPCLPARYSAQTYCSCHEHAHT